ncbi:MAG: hypothetical protein JAY85_19375 [Candidatus Thiodiazotropha weberae]|uniref:Uncharacterized protein n=1 Tax=Candidatus Thiodiazotropha endoloripes TaxID=1818881 RepID=A0A1E2URP1_9GAMM|nr:hypothetical protein [Candidatus Thiodiazotropha endoloripes]MCG7900609.1 hypothetical protein [Candidatus Thiodiazotropha weberae]MCG7903602.1 hypothetical protein [Candidatus Thiodiazotropha weberae]ODB86046.1 hypothetical protein A3195_10305 [Candidatus Thiodiazotropha endoloripes]ODB88079.1 hypothetical protein A3193_04120 [Candidatus Thiodiazotropha endoloripes]ODB89518.1 hypothetical protein A3194_10145 [Candidatus Thiodiazotropha endoloripes]
MGESRRKWEAEQTDTHVCQQLCDPVVGIELALHAGRAGPMGLPKLEGDTRFSAERRYGERDSIYTPCMPSIPDKYSMLNFHIKICR